VITKSQLTDANNKVFCLALDLDQAKHELEQLLTAYKKQLQSEISLTAIEVGLLNSNSAHPKINTVKAIRNRTGCSLKEAVAAVEAHQETEMDRL
jgi:ribosomal protein L7/L12